MDKRTFIKTTGLMTAALLVNPFYACTDAKKEAKGKSEAEVSAAEKGIFTLPKLAFAYNALEPHIDALTMEIHYEKHHGGYVQKLNETLPSTPFAEMTLVEMMQKIGDKDSALRNNGGGHYNHSLFWGSLSPKSDKTQAPELMKALKGTFGSFDKFQQTFNETARTRFGSGWAWLSVNKNKKLLISSTPNQDNPLMKNLVEEPGIPVLGLDVWEHAYYLKYQNKRNEYMDAFWKIVAWEQIEQRYLTAVGA